MERDQYLHARDAESNRPWSKSNTAKEATGEACQYAFATEDGQNIPHMDLVVR